MSKKVPSSNLSLCGPKRKKKKEKREQKIVRSCHMQVKQRQGTAKTKSFGRLTIYRDHWPMRRPLFFRFFGLNVGTLYHPRSLDLCKQTNKKIGQNGCQKRLRCWRERKKERDSRMENSFAKAKTYRTKHHPGKESQEWQDFLQQIICVILLDNIVQVHDHLINYIQES